MSATTLFITELFRAANEVTKLGDGEAQGLLDRAVTTIRDLRHDIGIPPSNAAADAVLGLQRTSSALVYGQADDAMTRSALLEAAAMIRDLHIVKESGTQIVIPGHVL